MLDNTLFINVRQLSTGFIDIPGQISLNIYVQGCKKRCIGCQNPDLQLFNGGAKLFLTDINSILSEYSLSTWICWLGGDAVYQPESFKQFNYQFHKNRIKVALYTGRLFEEVNDLLDNVDLVIDGEWQGIQVKETGTNQRIWFKMDNNWKQLISWGELDLVLRESQFSNVLDKHSLLV
jgi:anaerobic ribonucleoside-triphosphate reductase activating protein